MATNNNPNGWKSQCGAKCRTTGKPCTRPPVSGRTRCRVHGGATPVGIASPHYKHGRRSAYLDAFPLPEPGAHKTTVTIPVGDRELASQSLELTLTLDHLGSIRDRVNALLHTKKV